MSEITEKKVKEFNKILKTRGKYVSRRYEKYKNFGADLKVSDKGKYDSVTDIDKKSEILFKRQLKKYGYDIIGEESQLPLVVGPIFFLVY